MGHRDEMSGTPAGPTGDLAGGSEDSWAVALMVIVLRRVR